MTRIVCMYFPKWPLQRLLFDRPELRDKAVVVATPRARRGPAVSFCSTPAAKTGVRPGMPVAEALAVHSTLHVEEENPRRDRQVLQELAHWAERFSPIVGLEETETPECLLLDVTGCAAFFHSLAKTKPLSPLGERGRGEGARQGRVHLTPSPPTPLPQRGEGRRIRGEDKLLRRAHDEIRRKGWFARVALAGTVGAAWALAHFADTPCLVESAETVAALRPLPLAALRLPDDTRSLLSELGVERIEQLLALPRSGLSDRLGVQVLARLDQALGDLPEVVTPHRFLSEIHAFRAFPYGTDRAALVKQLLEPMIEELHGLLYERGLGVRRLEWRLYHEQAAARCVEVGLVRPSRAPDYLRLLLHAQVEDLRLNEPVCAMALQTLVTEPLFDNQAELFDSPQSREELSAFLDHLSNRLGRQAVTRPVLVADAQPELACRFEPVVNAVTSAVAAGFSLRRRRRLKPASTNSPPPIQGALPPRPICLWPRPAPVQALAVVPEGPPYQFHWAGKDHRILRAWGPERIETGWWRGVDVERDYYRVETASGARYWLFRRQDDGRWFLHGCFD